jgi:hypothetical protein
LSKYSLKFEFSAYFLLNSYNIFWSAYLYAGGKKLKKTNKWLDHSKNEKDDRSMETSQIFKKRSKYRIRQKNYILTIRKIPPDLPCGKYCDPI